MSLLWQILAGVGSCFAFIMLARTRSRDQERLLYGIGLAGAAFVYLVLAVIADAQHAIPLELLGVLIFGSVGTAGIWKWPWALAIGWIAHVAWDLGIGWSNPHTYVPEWYPIVCIGWDVFLAGYITGTVWQRAR